MKKIIFTCGGVAGLFTSAWFVVNVNYLEHKGLSGNMGMVLGYASMILAFSLILVGVKNYRDNYNGGVISFGRALKISLLITLVASVIYTGVWMIDYYFFIPDFGEHYVAALKAQMIAEGKSAAEIKGKVTEMTGFFEMYKNPFFNALMTLAEIAPVGIVMSILASLALKRKVTPAMAHAGYIK